MRSTAGAGRREPVIVLVSDGQASSQAQFDQSASIIKGAGAGLDVHLIAMNGNSGVRVGAPVLERSCARPRFDRRRSRASVVTRSPRRWPRSSRSRPASRSTPRVSARRPRMSGSTHHRGRHRRRSCRALLAACGGSGGDDAGAALRLRRASAGGAGYRPTPRRPLWATPVPSRRGGSPLGGPSPHQRRGALRHHLDRQPRPRPSRPPPPGRRPPRRPRRARRRRPPPHRRRRAPRCRRRRRSGARSPPTPSSRPARPS